MKNLTTKRGQMQTQVIRRRDSKQFSIGDKIKINTLITEIKSFNILNRDIMVATEYGDFNIDIVEKFEK